MGLYSQNNCHVTGDINMLVFSVSLLLYVCIVYYCTILFLVKGLLSLTLYWITFFWSRFKGNTFSYSWPEDRYILW
jgi:hypothetical protein